MYKSSMFGSSPYDQAANRRKIAIGQRIRALRGEMSQEELGIRFAEVTGNDIASPQTNVSRWELGRVDHTLEMIWGLEEVLRVPHGTLAASAGYISKEIGQPASVEEMILTDPNLDPEHRDTMLTMYRSFVHISGRRPQSDGRPSRRGRQKDYAREGDATQN